LRQQPFPPGRDQPLRVEIAWMNCPKPHRGDYVSLKSWTISAGNKGVAP
jgi:hypothetical protein